MNRTPDLLASLRAEILAAPPADLPSIIGQVEAMKAEAFARLVSQGSSDRKEPVESGDATEKLVTIQEAAEILGQSPRWVRDHQNELPRVKLPGRTVRFAAKRLNAFIRRRAYG